MFDSKSLNKQKMELKTKIEIKEQQLLAFQKEYRKKTEKLRKELAVLYQKIGSFEYKIRDEKEK